VSFSIASVLTITTEQWLVARVGTPLPPLLALALNIFYERRASDNLGTLLRSREIPVAQSPAPW